MALHGDKVATMDWLQNGLLCEVHVGMGVPKTTETTWKNDSIKSWDTRDKTLTHSYMSYYYTARLYLFNAVCSFKQLKSIMPCIT